MNPKKKHRESTSQRNNVAAAYNTTMAKTAVVSKRKKKTASKKQKRHVLVMPGIYRHLREGTYHERPEIDGKRTWRSLGVDFTPQRNQQAAKEEYYRRRTMKAEGKDPYNSTLSRWPGSPAICHTIAA